MENIQNDLDKSNSKSPELLKISPEKETELSQMKKRIENALLDEEIKKKITSDFEYTFSQLGLESSQSSKLTAEVFSSMLKSDRLDVIEVSILHKFQDIKIGDKNIIDVLHEKLEGRADLIFLQVEEYLKNIKGKVIDFGAGDGQVTQKLQDKLGLDIDGVDVRNYPAQGVSIKINTFDGKHVEVPDDYYKAALMTNVAHHEKENENIIKELTRIVGNKLVVIETIPVGKNKDEIEKDRERTFMNDYLYNRLFHNADIPVPGAYETPDGWINRFQKYGWKLSKSEGLGYDQPTIRDVHHLLVFEK